MAAARNAARTPAAAEKASEREGKRELMEKAERVRSLSPHAFLAFVS